MSYLEYSNPSGQFSPSEDSRVESTGPSGRSFYSDPGKKLVMPQALDEKISLLPTSKMDDYFDPRREKLYKYFHMNAAIKIENVVAESYQIIQTVRMTRGTHGKQNGCTKSGEFDAFVDGGKCSPGNTRGSKDSGGFRVQKEGESDKPYFLRPEEISQTIRDGGDFDGSDGNGLIVLYDAQSAAVAHKSIVFRSYIIAVNYNKTDKDRVLGLIKWGFGNYGQSPSLSNSNLKIRAQNVYDDVDKQIILADYPYYNI